MNYKMIRKDKVSICHNNECIHAEVEYAERITTAVVFMLLLIGFGALLKLIK